MIIHPPLVASSSRRGQAACRSQSQPLCTGGLYVSPSEERQGDLELLRVKQVAPARPAEESVGDSRQGNHEEREADKPAEILHGRPAIVKACGLHRSSSVTF
jgi:hypothetical protein